MPPPTFAPRDIPDDWIQFFGPYKGKTYLEIKNADAVYAEGLRYILAPTNYDKYFI